MLLSPFYIEPRKDSSHIDLNGRWLFTWEEAETGRPDFAVNGYEASLPKSTYYNLFEAGVMPHPYENENSEQYLWVREKVWYYKKVFSLDENPSGREAVLCFDGVAYYSKIWINGQCVGGHEGMFGGPFARVTDKLNFGGENELLVEVKAPSFGDPDFTARNHKHTNTQIVPWCAAGDEETSSQNFVVMGIWRDVRMELLSPVHLSRPVLLTESVAGDTAFLRLETEILDGQIDELCVDTGITSGCYDYTRAFDGGLTGEKGTQSLTLVIEMREKESGRTVFSSKEEIQLDDREKSGINPKHQAPQFFTKSFTLDNPRLWYPHTMGEPFLYEISLSLFENDEKMDALSFDCGIKTLRLLPAAGEKYRHRWGKFQFEVNGKQFFLKGMNHTPVDFLYEENPEEIRWVVETAKNAGIELLRVWNGGGCPESNMFYSLCDRYGILVWQDWFIANMEVPAYPQDVLEAQMQMNLYRIRNHPSLAVHCGGNEFNPYAKGNAAAMYVMQRSVEDLDEKRPFIRTTADGGSAHIYRDIEPIWFQKRYKELPFVGESGIHSFPKAETIKRLIPKEEYDRLEAKLPDLFIKEDMQKFPSFLAHFVEYVPERIPRMIARVSSITNVTDISISDFAEATHLASYEFYQMMIFSLRDNYPKTAGVMPWVYKRPWPTVGIQCVDGLGYPIAPYYSVKNAYSPVGVMLRVPELTYAPGEEIPLTAVVFNDRGEDIKGCLTVTAYSPELNKAFEKSISLSVDKDTPKTELSCGCFSIPESYTDHCFFLMARIETDSGQVYQTVYWPKCISSLSDAEERSLRRSEPQKNPIYDKGPWLKETVESAGKTMVEAECLQQHQENGRLYRTIRVKNTGGLPAFPVRIDSPELPPFYTSDNYFLLAPGEERNITLAVRNDKDGFNQPVCLSGWNFDTVSC